MDKDIVKIQWDKVKTMNGKQVRDLLGLLEPRSLKYSPHVPTPKQQVFMNLASREAFFGGAAGGGKDLSLDTIIPTPTGEKLLKDIHPGDYVYSELGEPIRVLAESEIFSHKCYNIVFDNDEVVTAGATHLWTATTKVDKQRFKARLRTRTTEEMSKDVRYSNGDSKYSIPKADYHKVGGMSVKVNPYILGFWLGDGTRYEGRITTDDLDVVEYIKSLGYDIHKSWQTATRDYTISGLITSLKQYNLIGANVDKVIPEEYFHTSYSMRLEILQGLMDSDGTIDERGVMSFCNTELSLVNSVRRLLTSLGIKHGVSRVKNSTGIGNYAIEYRLNFSTTEPVFKLARKANRQKARLKGTEKWYYIRDIYEVPSVPTKCIQVDNPTGLFQCTRSGIVTHNSDALLMDALQYSDVKGYAAIIFRKSFADLVKPGALIDRAKEWLMPFVHTGQVVWREKDRKFEFIEKYGRHSDIISILQFGYLETENDKYNYQGKLIFAARL